MEEGVDRRDVPVGGILGFDEVEAKLFRRNPNSCLMQELLRYHPRMRHEEWLHLLGKNWDRCHTNNRYREELIGLLGNVGPVRQMMWDDENYFWDSLPDEVEIYRGCDARYENGISWSLFHNVARRFPMYREQFGEFVLITATARKTNILAVKKGVDGNEVITFDPHPLRRRVIQ